MVRQIIRKRIMVFRRCYEDGLARDSTLAGRVDIAFSINARGQVASSRVHATSLDPRDQRVSNCFAKAFIRWIFPKPAGGATVSVVYPFMLSPS
jgi:outer membrane biosynthesis protein TonB